MGMVFSLLPLALFVKNHNFPLEKVKRSHFCQEKSCLAGENNDPYYSYCTVGNRILQSFENPFTIGLILNDFARTI